MRIEIKGAIISNNDKWIYDWLDMEATCPRDVQTVIDKAMGQQIDVFINSGGGDIFAGSEIYSALRQYKGKVMIHVVGLAASAASVILCAAESDITPTGMVMVHNVSSVTAGDYHDMDHKSDVLQKANQSIAAAYVAKTGMTEAEALAIMDCETWLPANDAVKYKLVDRVAESAGQLVAAYGMPMLPQSVIERIRNTVKNPHENDANILLQKAQAELELMNLGGNR